MRRVLVFALFAAALATAGPAAARERCAPHARERVAARSQQAVALTVPSAYPIRVIGCSRATGRRRAIAGAGNGRFLFQVLLTGTRVALVEYGGSRYGDSTAVIVTDDALHRGRRALVGQRSEEAGQSVEFPTVVLADDGRIAWLEPRYLTTTLRAWKPGDTVRTLDEAIAIDRVQLPGPGAPDVEWTHDGLDRNSRLWTAPDRCPRAGLAGGTADLDLLASPTGTTACDRATGASAELPGAASRDVAVDAGWAAAWVQSSILVAGPATGATRTVPAGGRGYGVLVDGAGSVAWDFATQPDGPPATHHAINVDDASGPHVVWTGDDLDDGLQHDESLVLWRTNVPTYNTIGRALMTPRP